MDALLYDCQLQDLKGLRISTSNESTSNENSHSRKRHIDEVCQRVSLLNININKKNKDFHQNKININPIDNHVNKIKNPSDNNVNKVNPIDNQENLLNTIDNQNAQDNDNDNLVNSIGFYMSFTDYKGFIQFLSMKKTFDAIYENKRGKIKMKKKEDNGINNKPSIFTFGSDGITTKDYNNDYVYEGFLERYSFFSHYGFIHDNTDINIDDLNKDNNNDEIYIEFVVNPDLIINAIKTLNENNDSRHECQKVNEDTNIMIIKFH